jgi:hypothetical protein
MRSMRFRVLLTRRERFRLIVIGFITVLMSARVSALPQLVQQHEQPQQASGGTQHEDGAATPLSVLIEEAMRNDPAIRVAERWPSFDAC